MSSILSDTVGGGGGAGACGNYEGVVKDFIFYVEELRLEKEDGPPGGPYRDH